MNGRLLDFLATIKSKTEQLIKYNEIEIKQTTILPILQFLGWNIWDTEEVKPEHPVDGKKTVEGGKVDYCLKINNKSEIFIEVKRPSEDLEKHQEQLLDYSFREGVDLAVLSNGIVWWFYLAMKKGLWKERKFYAIDIAQQDIDEINQKFIQLLSNRNAQTGETIINAESIFKEHNRKKIIIETLPKAWNKLASGLDENLLNLLAETTESLCGFRPEIEDVKEILFNFKENIILPETLIDDPKPEKQSFIKSKTQKSPYGHRINTQAGQIDMLWHQLKDEMGRAPTDEEISNASNKTLTVSRITAHLSYWKKRGRYVTGESKVVTWDHGRKMEIIGNFIIERCKVTPEAFATAGELYHAYIDWELKAGKKMHVSKRSFGICLGEHGFQKGKGNSGLRIWRGIRLVN